MQGDHTQPPPLQSRLSCAGGLITLSPRQHKIVTVTVLGRGGIGHLVPKSRAFS